MTMKAQQYTGLEVAVIGMALRFPGADTPQAFWENLKAGQEGIRFFSDEELLACGVSPKLVNHPNYVKAFGILEGKQYFDAPFFKYTQEEATLMDPQTRLFHQCVWHALEDAGYMPSKYKGVIGLYAGAGADLNWQIYSHLHHQPKRTSAFVAGQLRDKDYVASHVSYNLDLSGPSLSLQTACSTSLVAVHMAVRALLLGEATMALAGGVSLTPLLKHGYLYEDELIHSADGHCRAFDAAANGVVWGEGAAVVVLKLLKEALADGDHIYAVIKGSAINNDGNRKIGYTAPSVEGQAIVIKKALKVARVEPESLSYLETHGTGTRLGDAVEIEALAQVFGAAAAPRCALGAVKTNIGHLDVAAGIAGFIKTVLCLYHGQLVPSLHFHTPNPEIDFASTPFYINTVLTPWQANGEPRRAGVSSFGIGGTNAHVILEEAPTHKLDRKTDAPQLICLSARSSHTLGILRRQLVEHLKNNPGLTLSDMAYTLHIGRKDFSCRQAWLLPNAAAAITALTHPTQEVIELPTVGIEPELIFLFPDLHSVTEAQITTLYERNEAFRHVMEDSPWILPALSPDKTTLALAFAVAYGVGRLLIERGVKPDKVAAWGTGKLVIDTLKGVIKPDQALQKLLSSEQQNGHQLFGAGPVTQRESLPQMTPEFSAPTVPVLVRTLNERPDGILLSCLPVGNLLRQEFAAAVLSPSAATEHDPLINLVKDVWLKGFTPDWGLFYQAARPRRISLPGYPFEQYEYPVGEEMSDTQLRQTLAGPVAPVPEIATVSLPRPELPTYYKAAEASLEKRIAAVWQTFFGYNEIGVEDNFFDLGGDSLDAMNVCENLRRALNMKIEVSQIFDNPTIASLAQSLQAGTETSYQGITPAAAKTFYPLTPAQKRMFVMHNMNPGNLFFNIRNIACIEGTFDVSRLEGIFTALIKRHEILRTSFHLHEGQPVQIIHDAAAPRINHVQGSEANLPLLIDAFIQPFVLEEYPLFRIGLIETAPHKYYLVADMHHIIADGISVNLLIEEFLALYQGHTLPALSLQYKDYAEWQIRQQDRLATQRTYWLSNFQDYLPLLDLPLDYKRPPRDQFEGEVITFTLSESQLTGLKQMATQAEVTLYMVLLAVYTVMLGKLSGQEDVVVGSPVAGRNHADLEKAIGIFINTVALRNKPVGSNSFNRFLQEVKEVALKAFAHQDFQFDDLVRALNVPTMPNRNPLFDVMFVFQNMTMAQLTVPGLTITPYDHPDKTCVYDLMLLGIEDQEDVTFRLFYKSCLFKRATVEGFIAYFRRLIEALLADPDVTIAELPPAPYSHQEVELSRISFSRDFDF